MRAADVAVVGDGIAGLTCALACARRGLDVVVVGARSIAAASRASAGVLAPSLAARPADDPAQRFLVAARDAWPAWLEALEEETGVRVPLRFGVLELDPPRGEGSAALPQHSRRLDARELAELEPALLPGDRPSALLHERDGAVELEPLLAALDVALARRKVHRLAAGARAVEGGREGLVVDTPAERIVARHLVLAGGAWSGAMSGVSLPPAVRPVAGVTARIRGAPRLRYVVFGAGGYLVPLSDALLVGATSRDVGFDARIIAEDRGELAAVADALLGSDPSRLGDHRLGFRPMTSDGLPIIDRDPADERIVHATGYSRNGVLVAPLAASCVAALVAGERPPASLAPFGVARFGPPRASR